MAPRKTAEKLSIEIQNLKPKRSVRKRLPTAKSLEGKKLNLQPIEDLSNPCDKIQKSQIMTRSATKQKLNNKVNLNGIKTIRARRGATQESINPEDVPPKSKKAKGACKQYPDERKTINVAEGIILTYNPKDVSPRNKKTKGDYKQNLNETKIMNINEGIIEPLNSQDLSPKKNLGKGDNKRNSNETKTINIYEGNIEPYNPEDVLPKNKKAKLSNKLSHVTDELHNPKDDLPNNKKAKAACRQNQKCAKIIRDTEAKEDAVKLKYVPTKIKERKASKIIEQEHNDIKIMLANEVIRNAFQKKPHIVKKPARPVRRRKKICKPEHSVEDPNKTLDDQVTENIQDVAKQEAVKNVYCRKLSSTVPTQDAPVQLSTSTSELPGTKEIPIKRRKLSLKREKMKPVTEQSQNIDMCKEGKEETEESPPIDCNATVFDIKKCTAPDSTSKTGETQSKKRNSINSRKNSGTSTSTCLSWTKDISSTSTITCVTVKTNDIVRIDNKLPIVKLTNVDHKIKRKHYSDNIFEESSLDSHLENSKFPSECSSVSIANLNLSQTLNLSTSSLTSVTTNRTANNCSSKRKKNERIVKLRQTLENLSCKMKNFDLEMINWIGYENDSKDAKTTNFHARIFEVLNYENEVIKYCKQIKRVLVGDIYNQQSTEDIEKCGNEIEMARFDPEDNLAESRPSKNVPDNTDKQNMDILEQNLESNRDKDTAIIPDREEIFNDSKAFEKDTDVQDNDDDDALSLFAESITGLESSRKNSSFANSVSNNKSATQPDFNESLGKNEHVSQLISSFEKDEQPASYQLINNVKKQTADSSTVFNKTCDGNMIDKFQLENNISSTVMNRFSDRCKVQNSDFSFNHLQNVNVSFVNNKLNRTFSNSVEIPVRSPIKLSENLSNRSNEFQNYTGRCFPNSFENNSFNVSQDYSALPVNMSENWNNTTSEFQGNTNRESVGGAENNVSTIPDVEQLKQLQLTMSNKQMHAVTTNIFKGVCIFNLIDRCKNKFCSFPHKNFDIDFVRSKLKDMNEEMFIREVMYLIKWFILKRKYGMCFVEECIRRNLTHWLVTMVKKFITKTNRKNREEETFVIEITEAALLHLNDANLELCSDILNSKTRTHIHMCEHFMKAISETQNFSRFKNVFIKLTIFMCQIGRSFKLDVATQLLERLCILPYDDALARALMKIIAKTPPSIFGVPMLGFLENQLMKNNAQLYNELINLKTQAEGYSGNIVTSPTQSPRIASSNVGHPTSTPITRADSPDTTNMDSANKQTEPVITRTITINRTINTRNLNMSVRSESSEEPMKRYEPWKCETTWRNYPPSLMSLKLDRRVFNQVALAPRAFNGALPKFRQRPPQDPY